MAINDTEEQKSMQQMPIIDHDDAQWLLGKINIIFKDLQNWYIHIIT